MNVIFPFDADEKNESTPILSSRGSDAIYCGLALYELSSQEVNDCSNIAAIEDI